MKFKPLQLKQKPDVYYKIWTDGSADNNSGQGGWAFVLKKFKNKKRVKRITQGNKVDGTTSNRMELQAAIEALKSLPDEAYAKIYSDSRYVVEGCSVYILNWSRNKFRTTSNSEVKNKDLWKEMAIQLTRVCADWIWIKGHSGIKENEEADVLAKQFRTGVKKEKISRKAVKKDIETLRKELIKFVVDADKDQISELTKFLKGK